MATKQLPYSNEAGNFFICAHCRSINEAGKGADCKCDGAKLELMTAQRDDLLQAVHELIAALDHAKPEAVDSPMRLWVNSVITAVTDNEG